MLTCVILSLRTALHVERYSRPQKTYALLSGEGGVVSAILFPPSPARRRSGPAGHRPAADVVGPPARLCGCAAAPAGPPAPFANLQLLRGGAALGYPLGHLPGNKRQHLRLRQGDLLPQHRAVLPGISREPRPIIVKFQPEILFRAAPDCGL